MKFRVMLCSILFAFNAHAGECDFIQFNTCQSCDNPLAFSVGSDETCEFLCPNREVNHKGSGSMVLARNCALKECPKEFPFRAENGSCYASEAEAEDNRFAVEHNTNNENILKGTYTTAPKAVNGECPEDKPLLYSGKCFPCDEINELGISEEECAKCPNRVYKYYKNWNVRYCELPPNKDKPLRRWDGADFSCDESKVVRLPTHCNLEQDCEDICPNRTILYDIGGNVPSVPNCPPDKPLMDSEGICFSCDTPISVGLDWNKHLCQKFCPTQRHSDGADCVLN